MSVDYELVFWIVAGIASMIFLGVLWALAKKEAANYVDWVSENHRSKK